MSDKSEVQFQTLLAHLSAAGKKALESSNSFPPLALGLKHDGEIVAYSSADLDLSTALSMLQSSLQAKRDMFQACCIAWADYQRGCVIVNLENDELYCLEDRLPVETEPQMFLNIEAIETADGTIYVFGD